MKTKKLLLSVVLVIWCSTSTAQASKSTLFTDCYSSIDTVGCFLNLAKQKALSNKDKKQQAEQAGKVLSYLGHLHRTDFELVSSAAAIANDKSLGIEEYLDLQIALATYFIERDEEQAKKHLSNASKLFATALETDRPTDRSALYRWSCGLIDQHPLIWRQVAYITASTCTLKRIGEIEVKELTDEVLVALQKIDATWVQSDFEGMESQREIFSSKLKELEAIGIKAKSKSINETTQYFKVLALLSVADRYRRSGQRVEADKTLAQAQEALVGLEKINDGKFSLSARIMLADHHNGFLEFSKARDTLKPVVTKFSSPNALSKIDSEDQVELLVTLAYAIDAGGFLSQSEAIGSRSERQIRQADVLYARVRLQGLPLHCQTLSHRG